MIGQVGWVRHSAPMLRIRVQPRPLRREHWDQEIDIAEITSMPAERQPFWRWRRIALLTAGGVLVSTALLRMRR